jgi:UDP-glucose 4-epimerase
MIVLITGALGHIGSALTETLLKKKNIKKIIILDNVSNNRYNSFINFTNRNKIIFFDENIINFNFNLIKNKIDFCVHLAAHTNAEESFEMRKKLKDNNVLKYKSGDSKVLQKGLDISGSGVRCIWIDNSSFEGLKTNDLPLDIPRSVH